MAERPGTDRFSKSGLVRLSGLMKRPLDGVVIYFRRCRDTQRSLYHNICPQQLASLWRLCI